MKTNSQIKQDVINALKWNREIKEEHIGVMVHNAAVTLTGHVPNYWQKRSAKEAVKHVADVKAVVDEVEVCLESEMRTTDEGLAEEISNVLRWNVSIHGQNVKAEVRAGVVTLTGEVDRHDQRLNIERNIEHVGGVVCIVNLITVKPHASIVDVKKHVRAALERHANIEAATISVATSSNDTVILSGTAESLAELDRIEEAAWSAPGVNKVINNMRYCRGKGPP